MAETRFLIEADNRSVAIAGERIVSAEPPFDAILRFPGCEIRAGLVNAHDHLHRNHYGRLGNPPYSDTRAWAEDIQHRLRNEISAGRLVPRRDALLVGAWKNLFAGVTTVVHHDPWEADFAHDFPIRVAWLPNAHSLGALRRATWGHGYALTIHLAEGIGEAVADEVRVLDQLGLLTSDLVAVHGVGMDDDAIARFRGSGAALVWCPSSNEFLFGRTAPPALLAEGIDVLLGSDSLLTGKGNLLDELHHARETGLLSDARLECAVGATAARRLGLTSNDLAPGSEADVVVLAKPLLEASADDVELVVVAGIPRVARPNLAYALRRLGYQGGPMTVGGVQRWANESSTPVKALGPASCRLNLSDAEGALPHQGGG